MKLKVTKRDLILFLIFSIFLLYFSSVAVLNVLTLINDGEFYGLNPIEAFSPKYIFATLLVFISVLSAVIFSVSSTIFDRGNGIGLEIGEKKSEGYSRWLKAKEMKKGFQIHRVGVKDPDAPVGGVVLINDGKNMWVDNSEFHSLILGTTGSGKTSAVVDPLIYSLSKHGESMVITDPKGEIFKDHSAMLRSKGYNIIVLNFRDPKMGSAWNPLSVPYRLYKEGNTDKAIELVDDVAINILKDPNNKEDPFWENSAADYFSGCALGLFEDAKEEEININSVNLMTTVGEERLAAGSNYIKEYFTMKGESSSAYVFASNTINAPNDTKGSILSIFRQKIRLFASREQLSEMLSHSDFDMRDIGTQKTAVFMVIHDEKRTYHALATIFIKQCYETLISVAQENGGKLPYRTNFILDEFANMPALKDVTTMVTAARSRLIRFNFIIQNLAQLKEVYGENDAETIRSNCGNLIYLLTTELSALEEISKLCGEVKDKDKNESHPLITVSDLQKLEMNEVIIIRHRMNPFRVKLKQAYTIDWGVEELKKEKVSFEEREVREISLFDLKNFVTLRRKSKINEEPKGMGGLAGNSFMNMLNAGLPGEKPKIPTFEEFKAAQGMNNQAPTSSKDIMNILNGNQAPAGNPISPMEKKEPPAFDFDNLIKRIDAKIAELEAEEKAEEAKKELPFQTKPADINLNSISSPTEKQKEEKRAKYEEENPTEILKFDDLLQQGMPKKEEKPEVMVANPIDTITKIPEIPKDVNIPVPDKENKQPEVSKEETKNKFFDDFFEEED